MTETPQKRKGLQGHRSSMTLVEILIATFILVLGLVGIMSLVPVAIRQAGDALRKTHAASVAQNVKVSLVRQRLDLYSTEYTVDTDFSGDSEWINAAGDFSLPDDFDSFDVPAEYNQENLFIGAVPEDEDPQPYAWTALVDLEPDGPDSRHYHVEITVYFPHPYVDREVHRTTFMMKKP